MDLFTGAALAFGAMKLLGAKKSGTSASKPSGTESTTKPNAPGQPTLTIDKIHKFPIDKVDFVLEADGQSAKGDHKAKNQTPTTIKVGDYTATAITDPQIRTNEKKVDVVMIVVRDKKK